MKNNIFKMHGSYIGAFIGLILGYLSFAIVFDFAERGEFVFVLLALPFVIVIICFFLGYFFHLLLRYLILFRNT